MCHADANLLGIIPHACIQIQNMLPNEPNQITEVRCSRFVANELQHVGILHSIDIQSNRANRYAHHRLRMVEELDSFGIQREVIRMLIVEEVYRVRVQLQAKRLEEQYIIAHHILIGKVELVDDY